jgi:hypothetical protein
MHYALWMMVGMLLVPSDLSSPAATISRSNRSGAVSIISSTLIALELLYELGSSFRALLLWFESDVEILSGFRSRRFATNSLPSSNFFGTFTFPAAFGFLLHVFYCGKKSTHDPYELRGLREPSYDSFIQLLRFCTAIISCHLLALVFYKLLSMH